MNPKNETEADWNAQKVAFLTCEHDLSQTDIASRLNVSQGQVSRLLKRAEKKKFFDLRFDRSKVSKERMAELDRLLEPTNLLERLQRIAPLDGVRIRSIRYFDTGSGNMDEQLNQFGSAAAKTFHEVVSRSEKVAVGFGMTLQSLVNGLRSLNLPPRAGATVEFFPVAGDPVGVTEVFSSTRLAEDLNDLVNGPTLSRRHSLVGVHFVVPAGHPGLKRYFQKLTSYPEIFGTQHGLIGQADTLITSIGRSEKPLGRWNEFFRKSLRIEEEELQKVVCTDICGRLIAAPGNPKAQARCRDLNKKIMTVKIDHIRDIAKRSHGSRQFPGVIVAAIGKTKATAVKTLVEMGLINQLLCNTELKEELDRIIPNP